ncbi:hypothetical protein KDAU_64770 [Dictyobacter aurantiacus]|uniref:Uncharacterized protein n=1 Tax=Dictyobacter aurantiacus TaxID=1936993 RepID=A0A401ZQG2_9CHLR|nr:hypothetical protein KDAU_64770 [Dictyobacter aurantiacus]
MAFILDVMGYMGYNDSMEKERVTTKIWRHSLHKLKIAAATNNVSMIDLLERLIDQEYEKTKGRDPGHAGDTRIQDRAGPE